MNNTKGIICAALSALAFSIGGLLVKLIPWSAFSIVGGRCIFSTLFIVSYFIFNKQKLIINKTTIFGGILVMLNMATYVIANKLTTAANTIVLEYTAPVYIIIFNLIILHQKPTKLKIGTVLSVLFGIVLVMYGGIGKGNTLGNIIAAVNGAIYALQMMNNNFKGGDSVSSTLMGHILCAIVGIPSLITETNFSGNVLIYICLLGVFQTGLGYLLMALATKYTDPLKVSLVAYIEPILNPIWVLIFYQEAISIYTIIGIFIVLMSIMYYTYKTSAEKE